MLHLGGSLLARLLLAQPKRALFKQHTVPLGQILRHFNNKKLQ